MAFKALRVQTVDAASFNRSEQNTQDAFQELSEPEPVAVQVVISSATVSQYLVKQSDVFLVVDARGGPMKIVLYPPSGITQSVSIKNGFTTGNKVSVVQSNGQAMGGVLPAVVVIPSNDSIQMVNTGKDWFSF